MTDAPRRTITWFRRDLRLTDNRTLEAATRGAERTWPVFVADPALLEQHAAAPARVAWFAANLRALDERLAAHGSGLTVLVGSPRETLRDFAASVGATCVYAGADEEPVAVARDTEVARAVDLTLIDDARIVPPGAVRTAAGDPYTVYTPFRRALAALIDEGSDGVIGAAEPRLDRLAPRHDPSAGPSAFPAPGSPHDLPEPGEDAAASRLRAFLRSDMHAYRDRRDFPDLDGTSHLSPYLRVGAISVRACWRAALNAAARARDRGDTELAHGAATWRGELAWREFFAHVLHAHPRLADESFRRELDGLEWTAGVEAEVALSAWREGRTGYPLVDAGMRQLVATGWMHNRARLVTASFLVKDAGIDWRQGEAVFAEHLLDADKAQNNGNWQWVAGVGTDAAPYFRIFNPTLQAKRFDPGGAYVRRWIPELASLPDEAIHEPWRASQPPDGYPKPILDHAQARQRTLARYRRATQATG